MRYPGRALSLRVALLCLFSLAGLAAQGPPNVVIVFTDDQGYGDLGCYGAQGFSTPNIDRLAAEGVRFTDFYSAACVCTPSRAALLTGSYPMRVGLGHRVIFPYDTHGLHPDEVTMAELLKDRGYRTAAVGKWHLGHRREFLPLSQGFDEYYGIPYSNDMTAPYYARAVMLAPPLDLIRGFATIGQTPPNELLTRRFTHAATDFIRRAANGPFFLYLAHAMPHLPIAASASFRGRTEHGKYGDVIEEIDWSVGEILRVIDEAGVGDRTLVVFTSDNGPVVRPAERLGHRSGSAGPLRGAKNSTWEGGMREPALMRWPGRIAPGQVNKEITTTMDLLPTIAAIAGVKPPADRVIDGKDLSPLLFGQGEWTPREAFFYYRDERLQAVRSGKWKLHVYRPEWGEDVDHAPLLYDLATDVGEQQDRAAEHPEIVARLQGLAERARGDLGDAVTGAVGLRVRPAGRP